MGVEIPYFSVKVAEIPPWSIFLENHSYLRNSSWFMGP